MSKFVALGPAHPAPAVAKLPWVNTFTQDFCDRFCAEVVSGRSQRSIAMETAWAPSARTIYYWLEEFPDFREANAEGRRIRADALTLECVELADKGSDLNRVKIQIEARQWLAARMAPHDHGDRKMVEQNINARVATVTKIDVSHLTDEEILIAERALLKAVGRWSEDDEEDEDDLCCKQT